MIRLISREEVFYLSSVADHYISACQTYSNAHYHHSSEFQEVLDHLVPFHRDKDELDDFAVIAYKENKLNFLTHRSNAFIHFFNELGISRLFLLDERKYNLLDYPFGDFEKKQFLKSIVNKVFYDEALEFDVEDLLQLLPLFNYTRRHSEPLIYLFPAYNPFPIGSFICDDKGFHTSFSTKDREKIASAASSAGLIMGGLEVCGM
jgi:hypothetical protein